MAEITIYTHQSLQVLLMAIVAFIVIKTIVELIP